MLPWGAVTLPSTGRPPHGSHLWHVTHTICCCCRALLTSATYTTRSSVPFQEAPRLNTLSAMTGPWSALGTCAWMHVVVCGGWGRGQAV